MVFMSVERILLHMYLLPIVVDYGVRDVIWEVQLLHMKNLHHPLNARQYVFIYNRYVFPTAGLYGSSRVAIWNNYNASYDTVYFAMRSLWSWVGLTYIYTKTGSSAQVVKLICLDGLLQIFYVGAIGFLLEIVGTIIIQRCVGHIIRGMRPLHIRILISIMLLELLLQIFGIHPLKSRKNIECNVSESYYGRIDRRTLVLGAYAVREIGYARTNIRNVYGANTILTYNTSITISSAQVVNRQLNIEIISNGGLWLTVLLFLCEDL